MSASDDLTVGEVGRRLDEMRGYIKEGFDQVNARFDKIDVVSSGEYRAHREADKARFEGVEEDVKEIQRRAWGNVKVALAGLVTIGSSVIGAVLTARGVG